MPTYKFGRFNVDSQIELDLSQTLEVAVRTQVLIIDDPEQAAHSSAKLVCEIDGIGRWWACSDGSIIFLKVLINLITVVSRKKF